MYTYSWFEDSQVVLVIKNLPANRRDIRDVGLIPRLGRSPGGGFPGGASDKEPACQCRRHKRGEFKPWIGKISWGGHGNRLQYSCLENLLDREAWLAVVCRVTKSWTQLKRLSTHAGLEARHGRYSLLVFLWPIWSEQWPKGYWFFFSCIVIIAYNFDTKYNYAQRPSFIWRKL